MKITVAVTSFTGSINSTCFAEFWPQVNGTYIQEEKMNTLQSDRPLIKSSIKELLHFYKPPNVINSRMYK
jgi:UDP-glucose 6-dehydrogenase